jgi:hypothetical protein
MSAIMTWKRDKHQAQANMLEPIECIQTVSLVPVIVCSRYCAALGLRWMLCFRSFLLLTESFPQAQEFFDARLRALSPTRGLNRGSSIRDMKRSFSPRTASPRTVSPPDSRSNPPPPDDSPGVSKDSGSPDLVLGVRFDDVRPKTAGTSLGRFSGGDSAIRPQTARSPTSRRTASASRTAFASTTAR